MKRNPNAPAFGVFILGAFLAGAAALSAQDFSGSIEARLGAYLTTPDLMSQTQVFEGRVDGSVGWTHSRAIPVRDSDGAVVEWFAAASDVSDRKYAELALEAANAQLRESDRRKSEFLGLLSHELRNPLAPIRNSVYILQPWAFALGGATC